MPRWSDVQSRVQQAKPAPQRWSTQHYANILMISFPVPDAKYVNKSFF
jgi:hypothetical protein